MLLYKARSNVLKAAFVKISDKKVRINPPEGWEEEEEENNRREEEEKAKSAHEAAELRAKELEDINALKEQIIAEAKKDAARAMSSAQSEALKLVDKAIKEGQAKKNEVLEEARAVGFEQGVSDGRRKGEALQAEAAETLSDAKRTKEAMIAGLEQELVEMVINVAETILRDKANINPQVILCLIRAGLSETVTSGDITVRVSQDDYDGVIENKEELMKHVGGGAKLDIVKDMALGKADCIIETSFGYIDSSLGQQLDGLKENLRVLSLSGQANA